MGYDLVVRKTHASDAYRGLVRKWYEAVSVRRQSDGSDLLIRTGRHSTYHDPASAASTQRALDVKLFSPADRARVAYRQEVSGTASDPDRMVYLVIHPIATSDYWVQRPIWANLNGQWTTQAYFGRSGSVDRGERFEVRAFAGVISPLSVGRISDWPKAAASSEAIIVVRQ